MFSDIFKNDDDLIRACINKQSIAWQLFIKKYTPFIRTSVKNRLYKYGVSLKSEDVNDICQLILSTLWEGNKLSEIKDLRCLTYWLSITSGNIAIEYIRKKRRTEKIKTISIFDKLGETETIDIIPSPGFTPADELSAQETASLIEKAIDSLPTREKLLIKLHIIHEKKYREIADMLGLPAGTVSVCIKRAKEKLREILKNL